jgi:predicted nucleic acid-binding protein
MYLLDTNVISATRVAHREPLVAGWLRTVAVADIFTAAQVLAEIEQGIRRKERDDSGQGAILRGWFIERVLPVFGSSKRALPFDYTAARIFASFAIPERAPRDDAMIAAVAQANGQIVVTRNVGHFVPLGVRVINPFELDATPAGG